MNSIRMINPIRTIIGALIVTVLAAQALGAAGATAKDRNDDGISDRWEKRHRLSLNKDQSRRDQDRDGLKNRGEFAAKTDPRDADTDNDGISDGQENAGTIADYDSETGELTIDLFAGGSVTTLVTEQTKVICGCKGKRGGKKPLPPENGGDESPSAERHGKQAGPRGPRGPRGVRGRHCSTNELVVDAMVHQAKLTEDGLAFKVIRLVKHDPDGPGNGQENAGMIAGYDSETGELTIDLLAGGSVTTLVTEQTKVLCSGKRPPRAERHGKQAGPNGPRGGPRGGPRCSTNELVVDAMVHHAELTEDGLAFKVIHLVKRGLDATGEGPPKPSVDA